MYVFMHVWMHVYVSGRFFKLNDASNTFYLRLYSIGYVCMHVCIYVRMCVWMYYVRMCECMYVFMDVCVCVCVCLCV